MRDFPRTVFSYSKVSLQTGVFRHLALLGRFTRQTFILCVCHRTKYMPTAKSLRVGRLLPSAFMAAALPARVGETRPLLLLLAPGGCPHPGRGRSHGSDGGFVCGLLQELGGEQGVGHGVRAPRGRDHQADFLVGPSPLRVQLAVVAERDLAGNKAGYRRRAGETRRASTPCRLCPILVPPSTPLTRDAALTPKQFGVLCRPSL